jgi:ornithine cyclodeaminase/alanine dehydrogenase-like protein (mu-crystallin family)
MIKPTVTVYIFTRTEQNTRDSGRTTYSTDWVSRPGKTAVAMKETTPTAASTALDNTNGVMVLFSQETGTRIRFMG